MQQANYIIRDATEADAEAIIRMHAQSWLDTFPNEEAGVTSQWVKERTETWMTPQKITSRQDRIKRALKSVDAMYKIAIDSDGTVIGIACPFRNEGTQRLGGLYVSKEYQGQGVAQQLMGEIIKWSNPKWPIELEVASYNERAKAFYRKYSFQEVEGSEKLYANTIPTITMIRKGDK